MKLPKHDLPRSITWYTFTLPYITDPHKYFFIRERSIGRIVQILRIFKRKVCEFFSHSGAPALSSGDSVFLAGQSAARQVRGIEKLDSLWDAEFRVSSQWGEDGIIEWLVHNLNDMPETFMEFGVENYCEANTRFLLQHRNWRGLVIDGSGENVDYIRQDPISWRHDLTAVFAFVTRDNINSIISGAGFEGELGILSIDIDGVDYWIWEAIDCVNPHILIVEYNSVFGDRVALSVPYRPDFVRGRAHYSNLYYGLSIRAAEFLAAKRGYSFVGTNSAGSNAFFVRNDRVKEILKRVVRVKDRPARFRESRAVNGVLTFVTPAERASVIAHLPVVDVSTNLILPLGQMGELYSPIWKASLVGQLAEAR
jgi:hypothetical protein